jgi:hypothetical protein
MPGSRFARILMIVIATLVIAGLVISTLAAPIAV